jgi:hypothetical protein
MKKKQIEPREDLVVLFQGGEYESTGGGLFAKDVAVDGDFLDVKTGKVVSITPERRRRIAAETNRFLENGNEIPFPDGHTWDAEKNLGDWPGPFIVHGDRLVGIVKAKGDDVVDKIKTGKINRVSMVLSRNHVDPKGKIYDECIIQCCATPIPVLTGQRDFVALSQGGAEIPVFIPKAEAPEQLREPSFAELSQAFTPTEPSFSELAEFFKRKP